MADRPQNLPEWGTDSGADNTPPPAGKAALGWVDKEKPPHQWFNWFFNLVYRWLAYFDDYSANHVHDGGSGELSAPKVDASNDIDWGAEINVVKATGGILASFVRVKELLLDPLSGLSELVVKNPVNDNFVPIRARNTPIAIGHIRWNSSSGEYEGYSSYGCTVDHRNINTVRWAEIELETGRVPLSYNSLVIVGFFDDDTEGRVVINRSESSRSTIYMRAATSGSILGASFYFVIYNIEN